MLLATIGKEKVMLIDGTMSYRTIKAKLFHSWDEYHAETFSPETKVFSLFSLTVHGKTYAERKACAEHIAKEFSYFDCDGLSWYDIHVLYYYFEKIGKRYGLLSAFRENGIC